MNDFGTDHEDVARGLRDAFEAEREKRVSVGIEAHRAGEAAAAAVSRQKEVVAAAKKRYDDAVAAAKREFDESEKTAAAAVKSTSAEHLKAWRAALAAGWTEATLRQSRVAAPARSTRADSEGPTRTRRRRGGGGEASAE